MSDFPTVVAGVQPAVISTYDPRACSIGEILANVASAAPASGTWPGSNRALACPITIQQRCVAKKIEVHNGATAAGNIDAGIYDSGLNLVVANGGVAQSGTNTRQELNLTDTPLNPGIYYLALAASSVTATFFMRSLGLGQTFAAFGAGRMSSAYPLPSVFTFEGGGTTHYILMSLYTELTS